MEKINLLAQSADGGGGGAVATPNVDEVFCDPITKTKIQTQLGCIPINDTNSIAASVAKIGAGIGGGIAILLIIVASYQIMTSSGDPRRMQAAKDLLFSAVAGIILIILAGFALRLIGADILGIF